MLQIQNLTDPSISWEAWIHIDSFEPLNKHAFFALVTVKYFALLLIYLFAVALNIWAGSNDFMTKEKSAYILMCKMKRVYLWVERKKYFVEMLPRKKSLISGQSWRWHPGFGDWKDGGQVYNDEQDLT